jgi:hypothetical protein
MHGPPLTPLEVAKTLRAERARLEARGVAPALALRMVKRRHGLSFEQYIKVNDRLRASEGLETVWEETR